jgi:hypothetical protein
VAAASTTTSMAMAAATEPAAAVNRPRPGRRKAASGPDRLTVLLLTLAVFLGVLALLASQLRATGSAAASRPVVVLRKVYETRVVTTVPGAGGGTSVTQSVSSSGSPAMSSAPSTRSS